MISYIVLVLGEESSVIRKMFTLDDDLELLNSEGQAADESKFASFFLGPTYRLMKRLVWSLGIVVICLCVSALIFAYTERKWDILNSEINDGEWDRAYISTEKYKTLKRINEEIDESVLSNTSEKAVLEYFFSEMCFLKKDVYDDQWFFGGSVDYVISVLTTTGWGFTIPSSAGGKLFTVIYFLSGLPLMMAFLFSLSNVIDTVFTLSRIKLGQKIKSFVANPDSWALYSVCGILLILLTLIALFSAIISVRREHKWDISGAEYVPGWADNGEQNWDYFDAFYFQIISMCTVGFGDFHHKTYDLTFGACQFLFVFIPICLFLTLVKTIINQFDDKREIKSPSNAGHQY